MVCLDGVPMSQVNPFAGYVAGSSHVQRQQAMHKDQQVRRIQQLAKDIALQDDRLEHQVESSEELRSIHDERDADPQQHQRKGSESAENPEQEEAPHVDVRA